MSVLPEDDYSLGEAELRAELARLRSSLEPFVPQQDLTFERELQSLLNRFCKENLSGTPDFILAEYMQDCLNSFSAAINKRENWYGREQDQFGCPVGGFNASTS